MARKLVRCSCSCHRHGIVASTVLSMQSALYCFPSAALGRHSNTAAANKRAFKSYEDVDFQGKTGRGA